MRQSFFLLIVRSKDDMYILFTGYGAKYDCPGLHKANLSKYESNDAEEISKDNIEELVVKYLETLSPPYNN